MAEKEMDQTDIVHDIPFEKRAKPAVIVTVPGSKAKNESLIYDIDLPLHKYFHRPYRIQIALFPASI